MSDDRNSKDDPDETADQKQHERGTVEKHLRAPSPIGHDRKKPRSCRWVAAGRFLGKPLPPKSCDHNRVIRADLPTVAPNGPSMESASAPPGRQPSRGPWRRLTRAGIEPA